MLAFFSSRADRIPVNSRSAKTESFSRPIWSMGVVDNDDDDEDDEDPIPIRSRASHHNPTSYRSLTVTIPSRVTRCCSCSCCCSSCSRSCSCCFFSLPSETLVPSPKENRGILRVASSRNCSRMGLLQVGPDSATWSTSAEKHSREPHSETMCLAVLGAVAMTRARRGFFFSLLFLLLLLLLLLVLLFPNDSFCECDCECGCDCVDCVRTPLERSKRGPIGSIARLCVRVTVEVTVASSSKKKGGLSDHRIWLQIE
mmetsp:Transcript_20849/g.49115  ORF Transcript_20849/g.49115 Transcript_20849/m.49115 type:complete len:256 (+) Transcript_20849:141-908(+)